MATTTTMTTTISVIVLLLVANKLLLADPSSNCPAGCTCAHRNGRYGAFCRNAGLTEVPKIKGNLMQLTLDDNNFVQIVHDDFFFHRHLDSLRILSLKNCSIERFGSFAFRNMELLEQLVLDNNQLIELPVHMFDELNHLKSLSLAGNKITRVTAQMFDGATGIEELDLSNNQISMIAVSAFRGMPRLAKIDLSNNQLVRLGVSNFQAVEPTLQILTLVGNPWNCDCHIRKFVEWHLRRKFEPAACELPMRNYRKYWDMLRSEEFACAPQIRRHRLVTRKTIPIGSLANFTCPVSGDPKPKIKWELSQLSNGTRKRIENFGGKHSIVVTPSGANKWDSTLSIDRVDVVDQGQYVCTVENSADKVIEIFQLDVFVDGGRAPSTNPVSVSRTTVQLSADMVLLVVVLIAAIVIVLVVLLAVFCFRKSSGVVDDQPIGTNSKQTYHVTTNGYGYQAIETATAPNGGSKSGYLENYYVATPATTTPGHMNVLPPPPPPPVVVRGFNETPITGDNYRGCHHQGQNAKLNGYAFDPSSNYRPSAHAATFSDSLPSSCTGQQDDSGYLEPTDSPRLCSLHSHANQHAPLADSAEVDIKIPLKETAL